MSVLTGADGQLMYGAQAFAKCREWTITTTRDAYENTCLGDFDRTYVEGLRGSTGTATILYDPSNSTANTFLNTIFSTFGEDGYVEPEELTFKMNRKNYPDAGGTFKCKGFLTSVGPSIAVGDVQAVSISFQINGKPDGKF